MFMDSPYKLVNIGFFIVVISGQTTDKYVDAIEYSIKLN